MTLFPFPATHAETATLTRPAFLRSALPAPHSAPQAVPA